VAVIPYHGTPDTIHVIGNPRPVRIEKVASAESAGRPGKIAAMVLKRILMDSNRSGRRVSTERGKRSAGGVGHQSQASFTSSGAMRMRRFPLVWSTVWPRLGKSSWRFWMQSRSWIL